MVLKIYGMHSKNKINLYLMYWYRKSLMSESPHSRLMFFKSTLKKFYAFFSKISLSHLSRSIQSFHVYSISIPIVDYRNLFVIFWWSVNCSSHDGTACTAFITSFDPHTIQQSIGIFWCYVIQVTIMSFNNIFTFHTKPVYFL